MNKLKKQNKEERNNKNVIYKIIILLLLVIIIALLIFRCSSNKNENKPVSEYEDKINKITKIDYSKRQDELNKIVEDGMINIKYMSSAVFKGKVSESFKVENNQNNHGDMIFEIYDETGNTIYKSKKIQPGYQLTDIELEKDMAKGKHECRIKIGYAENSDVASTFPLTIQVK